MTLDRLLLTTGGTGGHIFPALAVAEEARRRNPDCKVLFVGSTGPEGELAAKAGIEFASLPARGVLGKGLKGLYAPLWILKGTFKALGVVGRFKPQVAVGFGGYAAFCPLLAAKLRGVPTALHEQNSVPGVANKVLGRLAKKIFLSFVDAHGAFNPAKTTLTGNPVRSEITEVGTRSRTPGRNLLVLGGSQGARAINNAIIEALPALMAEGVNLLHQAGAADETRVKAAYVAAGADPTQVRGFMDDMAEAYAWADMALCRSGATTVFEVAAAGLPAIFVPYPFATHDHQTANATALADAGAARVMVQHELNAQTLTSVVRKFLRNNDNLALMGEMARSFSKPNAAAHIVDGLEKLTSGRK